MVFLPRRRVPMAGEAGALLARDYKSTSRSVHHPLWVLATHR